MDTVFFDASVLFKAAVTRFLLGAAQAAEYRAVWSERVVNEARDNLTAASRLAALAALDQNLRLIRDPVVGAGSRRTESSLSFTHPGDRHVLAAAIDSRATILITDNLRHFDTGEAARHGISVVGPDRFATQLAERNPYALVRYVERTPPSRMSAYIERLSRELPNAMALVAPLLDS